MAKKQFKTESKKLLDMMINSIYTHKEVFLRELISNASDACDKLRFRSLTDDKVKIPLDGYEIMLAVDKEAGTLTISDNGCGMTIEELEKNLGTIAKSGSFDFKKENANDAAGAETDGMDGGEIDGADTADKEKDVDIIGQFGVGFYSAFMVADKITVTSKAFGEKTGSKWQSSGVDGYTIKEADVENVGTTIVLHIKPDTESEKYSEFLDEWKIRELVKKYSDYIHYPIKMEVTKSRKVEKSEEKDTKDDTPEYEEYQEIETLNSMIPIWKKAQSQVSDEEYASFYQDKFFDFEAPLKVIRQKSEGTSEFTALMFIPARAPFDYYSREFEKGLQLYSSGVLIMDKCKDLIPDYFSFVRGLVDSADLSLNISREMLQHDRQLKVIAKAVEKKIASELKKMLKDDREKYEQFFEAFGTQLKYGVYSDYGMHKDVLQDLLMFKSSYEAEGKNKTETEATDNYVQKFVALAEYIDRMKEGQEKIYYAAGESISALKALPQVDAVLGRGYEILFFTEEVDEFAIKMLGTYSEKEFADVLADNTDLSTDAEKELLKNENESCKEMFASMKESIGDSIKEVKFTNTLGKHPACLKADGEISINMEKTLSKMPGANPGVKAEIILEINLNHPIAERLKNLYEKDKEKLADYTKILYADARLVSGMQPENPAEYSELVCKLMLE